MMAGMVWRTMKMMWMMLIVMLVLGAVSAHEQNRAENEAATQRLLSREYQL